MKSVLAIVPFLFVFSTAQASTAQTCAAELSNTKISFDLVDGQIESKSIHFASPKTPTKNMSEALELKLALSEKDHRGLWLVKIGVNIEKYQFAEDEGFKFPRLPPCECSEMPADFDHATFGLFTQGEETLFFECADTVRK